MLAGSSRQYIMLLPELRMNGSSKRCSPKRLVNHPLSRRSFPCAASRQLRRVLLAYFRFWPTPPPASSPSPEVSVAAQLMADASSGILSLAGGFHGGRADLEVLNLSYLYHEEYMAAAFLYQDVSTTQEVEEIGVVHHRLLEQSSENTREIERPKPSQNLIYDPLVQVKLEVVISQTQI